MKSEWVTTHSLNPPHGEANPHSVNEVLFILIWPFSNKAEQLRINPTFTAAVSCRSEGSREDLPNSCGAEKKIFNTINKGWLIELGTNSAVVTAEKEGATRSCN